MVKDNNLTDTYQQLAEPAWFSKMQKQAAKLVDKLPLPTMQRFKYNDWPLTNRRELITQDKVKINADAELTAKGVIFTDLKTALKNYPELVKRYFNTVSNFTEDKLLAYNAAYLNNGLVLFIPDGVELTKALTAEIIQDSTKDGNLVSHLLIIVGKNSKVRFLQHLSTIGQHANVANLVVEVVVKENGKIEFSSLDEMGPNTTLYFNRRAKVGDNAQVEWDVAFMNDGNTVGDLASELNGNGSYAYSKAIAITTNNQKVAINNRVINYGEHSTGLINQRGVLLENSKLIFNGIGQIKHGAHGSKADQQNRVLMMSDKAVGDANPLLLIDENDVIAAHAASVGPVDPIQMNYLMSRGLPYTQAERMVIHGFLDAVLGSIPQGPIKKRMLEILERKLINGQRSYYQN